MDISLRDIIRFWSKVAVGAPDECWKWLGGLHRDGYGFFSLGNRKRQAHRVAWEIVNGPIPDGAAIRHLCDNKACMNPAHLLTGSQANNVKDMMQRGGYRAPEGVKGEGHHKAKLTWKKVRAIRREYAAGGTSYGKLAKKYNTTGAHIGCIIREEIWKPH